MSIPSNAVFLSYASQDAEAAQRICDALRARGIEVWFDQSELRGGDAWDQKIRRQIKECVLFVPLISATTNARTEGYFRLEWKLAVDRSHLMAEDAPFIFPVAIDATSERDARVPDRFREVQWMRLGRDTPEAIAGRAAKVLAGEAKEGIRAAEPRSRRLRPGIVWPFVGIAMALFFVTKPYWSPKRDAIPANSGAISSAPATDAATLAKRAVDLTRRLNFTREDLAVAGDLSRKATELDPTLALAWGARARVEYAWAARYWDATDARRKAAQDFAKRALVLDPDEPNALLSHGFVLVHQRSLTEAVAAFQRGLRAAPDDNYLRRSLAFAYVTLGRKDEVPAIMQEAIRRDPRDPLNHMVLAALHVNAAEVKDRNPANIDVALAHLERAIAIRPIANALVWKATILASWKQDLGGALATLDQVAALPHEEATEDRMIHAQMWVALMARQPDRALAAAARTSTTYFTDQVVAGPIGWLKALAHQQASRENAAAEELRGAETVIRARLAANPDSLFTQSELAITLALQGRKDEAAKQFARYDASLRDQGQTGTARQVMFHAAMGDAKRTVAALREARKPMPLWFTDMALARDPWFDRVRGQAEFKAFLAESAAKK